MNKVLLLLILGVAIALTGHAQSTDSTTDPGYSSAPSKKVVSPAERAARQLMMLQKKLNLTQDQVIKLRMILVHQNAELDSLRSNPSGDKKTDNQTRRTINQDADGKTYAILTTDQQALYAKWKQDQQLKRQMSRAANKAPAADSTHRH